MTKDWDFWGFHRILQDFLGLFWILNWFYDKKLGFFGDSLGFFRISQDYYEFGTDFMTKDWDFLGFSWYFWGFHRIFQDYYGFQNDLMTLFRLGIINHGMEDGIWRHLSLLARLHELLGAQFALASGRFLPLDLLLLAHLPSSFLGHLNVPNPSIWLSR